jgi:hemin uptake protein HemP
MNTPLTIAPRAAIATNDDDLERFMTAAPARPAHVRSISSEQLFADFTEVQIAHGDAVYRLRRTALGKLILTK